MKTIRRSFSLLLAALLLISAPVYAFAEKYDIGAGDIEINANDGNQWVKQGGSPRNDVAPEIVGSSATNTITINSGKEDTAKVTLSDVTAGMLTVKGKGSATITVNGSNTFDSTSLNSDDYWCGAYIKNSSTTLIGSEDPDDPSSVSLVGNEIGLHMKETNVEVNNVTITAASVKDKEGEGIYANQSTLTLNKSEVTSTCEKDDGAYFNNSTLIVNGGSITGEGKTVGMYFYNSNASVTDDGAISGTGPEKGIYVYKGNLDVGNSAVNGNGDLSGVVVYKGALSVAGGSVTGYCGYDDSVLVKESSLTLNKGGVYGMGGENGVRITDSEAKIEDGTLLGVGSDEGICIKRSEVTENNGVVSGTCETDDGVYVNQSTLNLNGGSFTGRSGFLGLYIDESEVNVSGGDLTGIGGAQGISLRASGTFEYDDVTGEKYFRVTNPASLNVTGGTVTGYANNRIPGEVIAAAAEESGQQVDGYVMSTAGIYVSQGVSVVVTDGTVTGHTDGNGSAAICGGIYMSEYASLSTGDDCQIKDPDGNDITDPSQNDPTTMNDFRETVIQKAPQPEKDDKKHTVPTISIDNDGIPEIVFVCSVQGTKIEKIGTPDAVAMDTLSQNMAGNCIYKGSFAFVDELTWHGSIRINFILPKYAKQHVTIATIVNGAQITYDRYVNRDGIASITVDHMGDFAVFLG